MCTHGFYWLFIRLDQRNSPWFVIIILIFLKVLIQMLDNSITYYVCTHIQDVFGLKQIYPPKVYPLLRAYLGELQI